MERRDFLAVLGGGALMHVRGAAAQTPGRNFRLATINPVAPMTEASPQSNVFNLLDSAFSGNLKEALEIYDEQRTQGEEPLKIFGMLVWQMHLVALVGSAKGQSDSEIMQSSGLKPFTLNKSKSIARRLGRERIISARLPVQALR